MQYIIEGRGKDTIIYNTEQGRKEQKRKRITINQVNTASVYNKDKK